jgi:dTDP-4-dehydrorhamnose reductase
LHLERGDPLAVAFFMADFYCEGGAMSRRLLLLGGSGQLGQSVHHQAVLSGWQVCAPKRQELDISNSSAIERQIKLFCPHAIINTAAYTQVDFAEHEAIDNWRINAEFPGWLAKAAAEGGALFLHLSTDYVFDGAMTRPYVESDTAAPLNAYGRAKLAGEQAVAEQCPRHLIVRTSWLFGGAGRHFVRSMLELASTSTHLHIVDDPVGGPTSVDDLARILLQMLEKAMSPDFNEWGIYHCTGQPVLSWYQFAQAIFAELHGRGYKTPVVLPISSEDYGAAVRRPLNSRLDNGKMLRVFDLESPEWSPAMQRFVADWCVTHPAFEKE